MGLPNSINQKEDYFNLFSIVVGSDGYEMKIDFSKSCSEEKGGYFHWEYKFEMIIKKEDKYKIILKYNDDGSKLMAYVTFKSFRDYLKIICANDFFQNEPTKQCDFSFVILFDVTLISLLQNFCEYIGDVETYFKDNLSIVWRAKNQIENYINDTDCRWYFDFHGFMQNGYVIGYFTTYSQNSYSLTVFLSNWAINHDPLFLDIQNNVNLTQKFGANWFRRSIYPNEIFNIRLEKDKMDKSDIICVYQNKMQWGDNHLIDEVQEFEGYYNIQACIKCNEKPIIYTFHRKLGPIYPMIMIDNLTKSHNFQIESDIKSTYKIKDTIELNVIFNVDIPFINPYIKFPNGDIEKLEFSSKKIVKDEYRMTLKTIAKYIGPHSIFWIANDALCENFTKYFNVESLSFSSDIVFLDKFNISLYPLSVKTPYPVRLIGLGTLKTNEKLKMYALLIDSQLKTHKFSYYDIGLKNYWLPVKSIQPSEQTFRIYCNNDIVADSDDIEIKFQENPNSNVIIDHIDQSEFQMNGLTQLAIDLRPTGCQEIDLKFKGPFDYEVICTDLPGGICIANVVTINEGEYNLIYRLDGSENTKYYTFLSNFNNLNDNFSRIPRFYFKNQKNLIKVPMRIYYHHLIDKNYHPVQFNDENNVIIAKTLTTKEEITCKVIKTNNQHYYFIEVVCENLGLHVIETKIKTSSGIFHILPFPFYVSPPIKIPLMIWKSFHLDIQYLDMTCLVVPYNSDIQVEYIQKSTNVMIFAVLAPSDGIKDIKISYIDELMVEQQSNIIEFIAEKISITKTRPIEILDQHLLEGKFRSKSHLSVRVMIPKENGISKLFNCNNFVTSILENDNSSHINNCKMVFSGLLTVQLSFETIGKHKLHFYKNDHPYDEESINDVLVVDKLDRSVYVKYKIKKNYLKRKIIEILIDARRHIGSYEELTVRAINLKCTDTVPQILIPNIEGTFIFGFYPGTEGVYEVQISFDGVLVDNGNISFTVKDNSNLYENDIIHLNEYCINGMESFMPKYFLPDFNPSNKELFVNCDYLRLRPVHTYMLVEVCGEIDYEYYDTSNQYAEQMLNLNFKNIGMHVVCFEMRYGVEDRLQLYPIFLMVHSIPILEIGKKCVFAQKVPKEYCDKMNISILYDEKNLIIDKKYFRVNEFKENWVYLETHIPSSNKEYQLCFSNDDGNYNKTSKFYVDALTDRLNSLMAPQLEISKLGVSLKELKEITNSQINSSKRFNENSQVIEPLYIASRIFNNKFSFCIYIDNFLKTDDIRDSYEITLLDPEGNPKDFTIKNFDTVSIYAMLFNASLEGIYTVKISEKNKKTEVSFLDFMISQYEIDCKNSGNYAVGKEVKVQIPLTKNFFQINGSTDFHVSVVDSDGIFVELKAKLDSHDKTKLNVTFTPTQAGYYIIKMKNEADSNYYFAWRNFLVYVAESGTYNDLIIYGSGLYYARIDQDNNFFVETSQSSHEPKVLISGPASVKKHFEINEIGTYKFTYIPSEPGLYTIKIMHQNIEELSKEYKVNVYGRKHKDSTDNIESIDIKVGEDDNSLIIQQIVVNIPNKCLIIENVDINVQDKNGTSLPVKVDYNNSRVDLKNQKTILKFSFKVIECGRYKASVREGDVELAGSPFYLNITREKTFVGAVSCVAYGPSLAEAFINNDNYFYINMNDAGEGKIYFVIVGPAEVEIVSEEYKENTYIVHWKPVVRGSYSIQIKFDDVSIPGSPFLVFARDKSKLKRSRTLHSIASQMLDVSHMEIVEASGPGLNSANVGVLNQFCVTGPASLLEEKEYPNVKIYGPVDIEPVSSYHKVDDKMICNYNYCPPVEGVYKIEITCNKYPIQNSPFIVQAKRHNAGYSLCYCEGPGINQAIIGEISRFQVDTTKAGIGYLVVSIESCLGNPADSTYIQYIGSGIYVVEYFISFSEKFNLNILFNGLHVMGSPVSLTPIRLSESKI